MVVLKIDTNVLAINICDIQKIQKLRKLFTAAHISRNHTKNESFVQLHKSLTMTQKMKAFY
jgi:hypothetical protein